MCEMFRWIPHKRILRHGIVAPARAKRMRLVAMSALFAVVAASAAAAADVTAEVAGKGCAVLSARVDAVAGDGPVFLRSYDSAAGEGPPAEPALATAAFTYDNAVAAIALTACGRDGQARRIAAALADAALHDRAGASGRLRNAYRGGAQQVPPPPNGWWDARLGRWSEDDYQVGTATGNVAWAGLALMTVGQRQGERRFIDAAAQLAAWVVDNASDAVGFSGGAFGNDIGARRLGWISTEHNIDLAALFSWLAASGRPGGWEAPRRKARSFVATMWDAADGHFLTGTLPDGATPNRATSAVDIQFWAPLLADADPDWRRALDYARRAHGAEGGFDFNDDRDGMWVEGTAHAVLAFRHAGRGAEADRYLAEIAREFSPGGYLWATRRPRITTGLAIGPDSRTADFYYYRRPHLGATAWAVLAALDWNPFATMLNTRGG